MANRVLRSLKSTYIDNNSVSTKEMFGFAGGIFGNAMGQDSTDTFADKFERDFMGINANMQMIKGNISTILGFFIPPIAGTYFDTPSKNLKRSNIRTALMYAPIPFAISSMLLFVVPTTSVMFNFIWTLFFGVFFTVVDTFYDIALSALALKMVSDPEDRKKFYTFESIASTLGSMLPGGVIPVVVGAFNTAKQQQWAYFFIALGFCILGVSAMYAPYMSVRERAAFAQADLEAQQRAKQKAEKQEENKIKWDKRSVSAILHNRPFVILQIATFCEVVRQITYKILPYLYEDVLGKFGLKTLFDTISGVLSYVGLMGVPFLGRKFSAKQILVGGYSYSALFYGIMSLFNIGFSVEGIRKKRFIVGLLIGFSGVPNAAQGASRKIIMADSTDYMEWYTMKNYGEPIRSDGLLSATQNITSKAIALVKSNLYNGIFKLIKYKEKDLNTVERAVQTDSTLRGIYMVASLCGFIGNLLPALCFMMDNYTGKRKDEIYEELVLMRKKRAELLGIMDENSTENSDDTDA